MNQTLLEKKFTQMGARLKIADALSRRSRLMNGTIAIDIHEDRKGEYFEIGVRPEVPVAIEVLDVQPEDRHLLLLVRETPEKFKFLCGHDERHWFVAAIPESAPVGTVRQAKEALKPPEVQTAQSRVKLRSPARNRRKNAAYIRQGEWFFVPEPRLVVPPGEILKNEPLRRGGGKAHWAEFCFRIGGDTVYVCSQFPNGVAMPRYREILDRDPTASQWNWRSMQRNATVFVRGRIRHPDHRTITLHGWHRVVLNTEGLSRAMRNVAFLD